LAIHQVAVGRVVAYDIVATAPDAAGAFVTSRKYLQRSGNFLKN
jgi:hypothetical protein